MGNIFEHRIITAGEEVSVLLETDAVKIERIVSSAGFMSEWYDQDEDEWLTVAEGWGKLEYEDGQIIEVKRGNIINIPAHVKHRVIDTSSSPLCIWISVFYN